jgi:hypothetical protein
MLLAGIAVPFVSALGPRRLPSSMHQCGTASDCCARQRRRGMHSQLVRSSWWRWQGLHARASAYTSRLHVAHISNLVCVSATNSFHSTSASAAAVCPPLFPRSSSLLCSPSWRSRAKARRAASWTSTSTWIRPSVSSSAEAEKVRHHRGCLHKASSSCSSAFGSLG